MLIPTKDIKVSRNEGRIFCLRVVLPVYAGLVHDFQETSPGDVHWHQDSQLLVKGILLDTGDDQFGVPVIRGPASQLRFTEYQRT